MSENSTPEQEVSKEVVIHVVGRELELTRGRKVSVFTNTDKEDDSIYLDFTNEQGEVTKLRLSPEAMDAVVRLYAMHLKDLVKEQAPAAWTVAVSKEGEITCEQQ